MAISPSIFDLLEPLASKLLECGGPDIRGGFARGTGGVDIDYIVEAIAHVIERARRPHNRIARRIVQIEAARRGDDQ